VLGASTWRIERINAAAGDRLAGAGRARQDTVLACDAAGRPIELGRALGEFSRRVVSMDERMRSRPCAPITSWTKLAARNLLAYLAEQKEITVRCPATAR